MSGSEELDAPRSGGVDTYNATGGANTWGSPFGFVAEALTALGHTGDIELDCAALASSSLGCRYFGPDHADAARRDALVLPWAAEGTRWINPPYSRQCETCPGFEWHDDVKGPGGIVEPGCKAKGHRSRTIFEWMIKCAEEGRREGAGPLVALPPARTDGWWHEAVMGVASRVLFVRGRLRFMELVDGQLVPSANCSPVPSAVVEYLPPLAPSAEQVQALQRMLAASLADQRKLLAREAELEADERGTQESLAATVKRLVAEVSTLRARVFTLEAERGYLP